MLLAPDTFFNWPAPRILMDIRPAAVFVKGSLAGAVSVPVESLSTWDIFTAALQEHIPMQAVHVIDTDGKLAALLAADEGVFCLAGGYRAFQRWRQAVFSSGPPIGLVGGKTGSGKTELLHTLLQMGRQVIDLEGLARHKGSVFGDTKQKQPPPEAFQNQLLSAWLRLDADVPVWMEEKGAALGKVGLPETLYARMSQAVVFELLTSLDARLQHLQEEYTGADQALFASCIKKLEKRMGLSANHKALHYHQTGHLEKCLRGLLAYYDQAYDQKRIAYPPAAMLQVPAAVFSDAREIEKMEVLILREKKNPAVCAAGNPIKKTN
jgi:hypothetical protein